MKRRLLVLPLSIFISANSTFAAAVTYQWNGTTDTAWATSSNWSGGTVGATNGTFDARLNVYDGPGNTLVYNLPGITTTYANTSGGGGRGLVIGNVGVGNGSTFEIRAGTFSTAGSTLPDVIANVGGSSANVSTLFLNGGNYTSSSSGLILGLSNDTGVLTIDGTNGGTATITTLQLGGAGGNGVSTINLNGGTLAVNTVLNGNSSQTKNFNFNGGVLQARTTTATFVTAADLPTATDKVGGAKIDTNGNTVEVGSVLGHDSGLGATADGGLTKSGAGLLTLSGTNTFTGTTAINAGALIVTNASALGTTAGGTSVALNASLALSGGIAYSNAESVTLTGPGLVAASGVFASVQRGSLTSLSGTNTFGGNISFTDSGNTRIGVQNGASLILTGNITESAANSSMIFRHSTTGVGNITLSGSGNSWTGNTDIYGGEGAVILGVDNAIPTTSLLRVGTSGVGAASTLDLNGKVQTVKGISELAAQGVITNNGAQDSTLTLANLSANQSFSGVIKNGATNKVALTLNSAGKTQTLSGNSTFTGATTINAGTLEVGGAGILSGKSNVILNAGGTLLLSGNGGTNAKLNTQTTVNLAGGTFQVSDTISSPLDQTLGALTLSASSVIDFGTAAAGNTFRFADSASLFASWSGTLSIYNWSAGLDHLFFGNGSGTGLVQSQLDRIKFNSDAGSTILPFAPGFSAFTGGFGEVTPVPEPSSVATVMGLLGLVGWRERRKANSTRCATRLRA